MDTGNIEILVSEEMVEKLGLKRLENPCPYKVGWLQDDHVVEVIE